MWSEGHAATRRPCTANFVHMAGHRGEKVLTLVGHMSVGVPSSLAPPPCTSLPVQHVQYLWMPPTPVERGTRDQLSLVPPRV